MNPLPTRCKPSRPCAQMLRCARAREAGAEEVVDASVSLHSAGAWCSMFVDVRGLALLRPPEKPLREAA
jgi:hypothetical protein